MTMQETTRAIELEGGYNFRDIGGYKTRDGRTTKWRQVFRSGKLSELTPADQQTLRDLDIKAVVDFRRLPEREESPSAWHVDHRPSVVTRPHPNDLLEDAPSLFGQLIHENADARDLMVQVYRDMPEDYADHYTEMFRLLADENSYAFLFHCTGGKDRTGLGAYLILNTLGVEEETIFEDYLLTNTIYPADDRLSAIVAKALESSGMQNLDEELFRPIVRVEMDYMQAGLEKIIDDYGSVRGYLDKRLKVTPEMIERMRDHLLE